MTQTRPPEPDERPLPLIRLSSADAEALDAILAARAGDPTGPALARVDNERAHRVQGLLDVIGAWPAGEADEGLAGDEAAVDALVEATLERARHARQRERFATQAQMFSEAGPGPGPGWRQVASGAFAAIIALALLLPALEHNRFEGRRVGCAANLSQAGLAMGGYAADNNGDMPRGRTEPGAPWWRVGQPAADENAPVPSNSAHLFLLVRQGYIEAHQLTCPENHRAHGRIAEDAQDWPSADAVSFSYQNQYTAEPQKLADQNHLAVLADRNPLFRIRVGEFRFDAESPRITPSRAHARRGQNVLTADGAVRWQVRPLIRVPGSGQVTNIWVADGVTEFTGHEIPSGPGDSFLVP
ncbi:MAG: hypothetical protein WD009_02055 [Phycisphaeraceae bacterium]